MAALAIVDHHQLLFYNSIFCLLTKNELKVENILIVESVYFMYINCIISVDLEKLKFYIDTRIVYKRYANYTITVHEIH